MWCLCKNNADLNERHKEIVEGGMSSPIYIYIYIYAPELELELELGFGIRIMWLVVYVCHNV